MPAEKISKQTRAELLDLLRQRYRRAAKQDKGKILDQFVAVAGCHRKHAIRLLTADPEVADKPKVVARRAYDEAVRQALIVLWEAAARALEVPRHQFPVPVKGIDSGNDSAFINGTPPAYCRQRKWEFTRSRAYHKPRRAAGGRARTRSRRCGRRSCRGCKRSLTPAPSPWSRSIPASSPRGSRARRNGASRIGGG
jgi:hypothetical protein